MMDNERDYGSEINRYTINSIERLIPKRIVPFDYYEKRDVDEEVKNWIERIDREFAVIVGDAGFGKTSLLCNLASELLKGEHYVIFFVKSENLRGREFHKKILDDLEITEMGLNDLFRKIIDENKKIIFLLDTLDIIATDEDLARLDDFLTKVRGENRVVIGASRPLEFKRIEDLATRTFELERFSDDELRRLFNKYKTFSKMEEVEFSLPVLEVCRNPLHMRMLFEVYQPHEIPEDINVQKLYDRYWYKRVAMIRRGELPHFSREEREEAEKVKKSLTKNIAYSMLTSKQITLSESECENIKGKMRKDHVGELIKQNIEIEKSKNVMVKQEIYINELKIEFDKITTAAYRDLLDEGVLREQEGLVEFFHQRFFEYTVARVLISRGDAKRLKEFLSTENVEIQSLAVGILARNRHLGIDRTLYIFWEIISRDANSHLTKRTIQYLSIFGEERLDDIVWIIWSIVQNERCYEYHWSVLVLIKDLGIKSPEIVEILKTIATTRLSDLRLYLNRKEAFELLRNRGVTIFPEAFKIDYLGELRQMTPEQALDYVEKLTHPDQEGKAALHLFAFDHNFLFFILRELYKVRPFETRDLMRDFLAILERSPFQHIFEILGEHQYFNPEIVRDFLESDNKLVSLTGFMALEYALNKVVDGKPVNVPEEIRQETLRLLKEVMTWEEEKPLIAAMAKVTYEEATNPSKQRRKGRGTKIKARFLKGAVDAFPPRMLKNFMTAEDSETKEYTIVLYWASYRGILHTRPDKLLEVFKVIGKGDTMFLRVCDFMYKQLISPEEALDILYKFALKSEESQIRVAAIDLANIVGRLVPERVLEIYEELLPLPEYQDNRTRLTLTHNFRNFLKTSQGHKAQRNLEMLMSDNDRQVAMLADIILNGIQFR